MKKIIALFLILCLALPLFSCQNKPTTVGLIPLDSRACNTQYAYLLGQMANISVNIPDDNILDNFTTPSNSQDLFNWLNNTNYDQYIIFTNQLLNGGLINSRLLSSYQNQAEFLAQLTQFITNHPKSQITLVSVLPRLLPSQYDENLWQYKDELAQFGKDIDIALTNKQTLPQNPANIPPDVCQKYLSLYQTNGELLQNLSNLTTDKVTLLIGQDDAEEYCPSNIIYRTFQAKNNSYITLLHGADELTMLALAHNFTTPSTLNIIYSDPNFKTYHYPYEADSLQNIIAEKLLYLNITLDNNSTNTLIIHTDLNSLTQTQQLLKQPSQNYFALADIAYTNKGDVALKDTLLTQDIFDTLDCYSGWNTTSNTIGTVLAHFKISQNLANNKKTTKSALIFKLTRYSEDLIYQAILSNPLRQNLLQQNLMDYTTTFANEDAHTYANNLLNEQFAPFTQTLINLALNSTQLADKKLSQQNFNHQPYFKWNRAFEIYSNWQIDIK